jgi:acetyl/propionyl-CoA carboxylase alpha subunit
LEWEGGLLAFEVAGRVVRAAVEVREDSVEVVLGGCRVGFLREGDSSPPGREPAGGGPGAVLAEISGKVTRIFVSGGDIVHPQQVLLIIEAMKMEHPVRAAASARVESVGVNTGDQIAPGDTLLNLLPPD